MAHKDYVGRGRSKKKPAPPPQKSLPWVRLVVTLGLVAGFSAFLYSIKDKATESTSETPKIVTAPPEQIVDLPDIPEEEWEFFKLLPQQTVTFDEKEQTVSDRRYLMQCASFRDKQQAEEMKANIAFQGLEPQVRSSQGSNGLWYRVILGPYELKRVAERDRHTLQRININTCKIWYWNL